MSMKAMYSRAAMTLAVMASASQKFSSALLKRMAVARPAAAHPQKNPAMPASVRYTYWSCLVADGAACTTGSPQGNDVGDYRMVCAAESEHNGRSRAFASDSEPYVYALFTHLADANACIDRDPLRHRQLRMIPNFR